MAPTGCTEEADEVGAEGETGGDGDGDSDLDEAAVIAAAMGYRDNFVLINAAPFASAHMGAMVNIYAHPDVADQYKAIDQDAPVATSFPEGAMFVKENIDGEGNPDGGTIMYKGPVGYSEGSGDWWFGMGDILAGELADSGPDLGGCIGCHEGLSETDWLQGVAADNQN